MPKTPFKANNFAKLYNPKPEVPLALTERTSQADNSNLYLYATIGAAIIIIGAGIYFHVKLEEQHSRTMSLLDQIESQNHFLMKSLQDINASQNKISSNDNSTEQPTNG